MSYKALIYGIVMLFLIGMILPLIVSDFITTSTETDNGSFINNFIENGITIKLPLLGDININPTHWLPSFAQSWISNALKGYSLLPDLIGLPLFFITAVLIIYGVVKIIIP